MGQFDELLALILSGESDAEIPFRPLCDLLKHCGFKERVQGGATVHAFIKEDVPGDFLILQGVEGQMAKAYQVEKVRRFLDLYDILCKYGG